MQALQVIRINTSLTQAEMPALELASKLMREAMRDVLKREVWSIQIETHKPGAGLKFKQQPSAVVCSMLQEITIPSSSLVQIATKWRAYLEQLRSARAPIYISNVFRHVAERGPDGGMSPRLERIRRVNRLLVDLAREFRAAVIDVDGVLADIGGVNLQADFRLGGKPAIKRIGYIMAMSLLSGPLGEESNLYTQQQAMELLRVRGLGSPVERSGNPSPPSR